MYCSTRYKNKKKIIQFYSQARVKLLGGIWWRWKLEADRNLHTRRPARLPYSTRSFLYSMRHYSLVPYHSNVGMMYVYGHYLQRVHIRTDIRAKHAYTDARDQHAQGTSAHCRSSNHTTLSLSRRPPYTPHYLSQTSTTTSLFISLKFSLLTCR